MLQQKGHRIGESRAQNGKWRGWEEQKLERSRAAMKLHRNKTTPSGGKRPGQVRSLNVVYTLGKGLEYGKKIG